MSLTNEKWKILPLDEESYFRVRGTQLGYRYKIANVPFPVYDGNERDVNEALEISKLIAAAPDLLEALKLTLEALEETNYYEQSVVDSAKQAIQKATNG